MITHSTGGKSARLWDIDSLRQQRDESKTQASNALRHRCLRRNRLSVRGDCLIIDDRVVMSIQLGNTVLDSVHLTHPGKDSMLHITGDIWFPHIHRGIVAMGQNCKQWRQPGKFLKSMIRKKHHAEIEKVIEPVEEVQLDFDGPMRDKIEKVAYILEAIDRFPRYPNTK